MEFLINLGFQREACNMALDITENDQEAALELLLSGVLDETRDAQDSSLVPKVSTMQSNEDILQCSISQYSLSGGQSACTIISMMIALEFLPRLLTQPVQSNDTSLFASTIVRGAAMALDRNSQHLSCEEVLTFLTPSNLVHQSGITLQGVVSCYDWPKLIIDEARATVPATSSYIAIVITKPPESICIIVPPASSSERCYLFDSHSRPSLGLENAYIVSTSEESLCHRLVELFPPFPGELDEWQKLQYNCFDATVFRCELTPPAASCVDSDWVVVKPVEE